MKEDIEEMSEPKMEEVKKPKDRVKKKRKLLFINELRKMKTAKTTELVDKIVRMHTE